MRPRLSKTLWLDCTTSHWSPRQAAQLRMCKMPVAISGIIAAVAGTSAIGVALQTALASVTLFGATAVGGALLSFGLSIGLNFLAASLFRPTQPKPEDVQQTTRQPTQPRTRHYGRVKTSGPWIFAEAKNGDFYKLLALGAGPVDEIEQIWIDDKAITVSGSGSVLTEPYAGHLLIGTRTGLTPNPAYPGLVNQFPEWTEKHRGDGIASLLAIQLAVSQEDYLDIFSNGINTNYRVVLRGARVFNPSTGDTEWNDRAAAVIRDYLTNDEGMRFPIDLVNTPLAKAGWEKAYQDSAERIETTDNASGTEPRYRLWGSYTYEERPADVLGRMLAACDGRLVPTPDGGLTLSVGKFEEPTVILDEDAIIGFSDFGRGRDIMTTANTIKATYLDRKGDYQANEADPWVDAADVSERGAIVRSVQFNMAPSHAQCRRLMKIEAYRSNPRYVGTFECNLRGLAALGKRFVRIQYPLFGINEDFEVQDFRFSLGEGGILTGVSIQVVSLPSEAYQWDIDQEGTEPVADDSQGSGIEAPDPPSVTFLAGPIAELSFTPVQPGSPFVYQARYKKTSEPESAWILIDTIEQDDSTAQTGTLDAATEYEFQLRLVTTDIGFAGDWSESTIDTTP